MDQSLQSAWLIIGLVTAVGVAVGGSSRRRVPGPLPTEHVVAAAIFLFVSPFADGHLAWRSPDAIDGEASAESVTARPA